MITIEKVLFLRNVSLFERMPSRELGHIASVATEVEVPAGQTIFVEGDSGESMYLIVSGSVRIHRGSTELTVLPEKRHFGEMAILDGEPRSATATAVDDTLLLRIDQSDFQRLLADHFTAALSVIRNLTRRIREVEAANVASR